MVPQIEVEIMKSKVRDTNQAAGLQVWDTF